MDSAILYSLAADLLLLLHTLFVLFVVFGLVLVYIGKIRNWYWVRNPWFRMAHLLAIGTVVIQSWAGVICPLTIWEMMLRTKAGEATYAGSFIAHWMQTLLYYQAPGWVFGVVYTIFGGLVLISWFWIKPRKFFK